MVARLRWAGAHKKLKNWNRTFVFCYFIKKKPKFGLFFKKKPKKPRFLKPCQTALAPPLHPRLSFLCPARRSYSSTPSPHTDNWQSRPLKQAAQTNLIFFHTDYIVRLQSTRLVQKQTSKPQSFWKELYRQLNVTEIYFMSGCNS